MNSDGPTIEIVGFSCFMGPHPNPLAGVPGEGEHQMETVMDTVRIFDTTLRDGEQSPGATLTLAEKVEIARHLESMGVDIIEAGFPISSDGDFESVQAIASQITRSTVCGLARCTPKDVE